MRLWGIPWTSHRVVRHGVLSTRLLSVLYCSRKSKWSSKVVYKIFSTEYDQFAVVCSVSGTVGKEAFLVGGAVGTDAFLDDLLTEGGGAGASSERTSRELMIDVSVIVRTYHLR